MNIEGRASSSFTHSEAPASYVFSGCNSLSGEHRVGIYIKRGVMKNEESAVNVKRRGHSSLILSLRAESGGVFPTDGVEKSQNYRQRAMLGDVSTAFPKTTGTSPALRSLGAGGIPVTDFQNVALNSINDPVGSSIVPFGPPKGTQKLSAVMASGHTLPARVHSVNAHFVSVQSDFSRAAMQTMLSLHPSRPKGLKLHHRLSCRTTGKFFTHSEAPASECQWPRPFGALPLIAVYFIRSSYNGSRASRRSVPESFRGLRTE